MWTATPTSPSGNRQISRTVPVTLYCLPYAGGNSFSYRPLAACCPPQLTVTGVELPGRGRRAGEALRYSLDELADDVYIQLRPTIGTGRYALFGHSMGAALAYLTLLRIRRAGLALPDALILSGKSAPGVAEKKTRHLMPRPEFVKMLHELGGCPPEILQEAELLDYFEPILRADFQAVETWQPRPEEPLAVPLLVLHGRDDEVTRDEAAAWAGVAGEAFQLHEFDGDHFFIQRHWQGIAALIGAALEVGSAA